jgi:hypothetical protein
MIIHDLSPEAVSRMVGTDRAAPTYLTPSEGGRHSWEDEPG